MTKMKTKINYMAALWSLILLCPLGLLAQTTDDEPQVPNDSVIDRTVTVEREFQPTVKAADKLSTKPQVYQPVMDEATVTYSDFSSPLGIEKNVSTLGYASTAFNRPRIRHGYIRGGVGHTNTMLDFNYRVDDETLGIRNAKGKAVNEGYLDLHANHFGQWGRKTLEKSSLGLDYTYTFPATQLYFSASGGNEFFNHYYHHIDTTTNRFDPDWRFSTNSTDNQTFWTADAHIGVQNVPGADVLYHVQTGYEGFFIPGTLAIQEHQVHTQALFEWSKEAHSAGLHADVENRFYTTTKLAAKHSIHVEPYYGYKGNRIRVHAGVNFDLGLGGYKGRLNQSQTNAFGISPNVHFEADITKTWLTFFLDAVGGLRAESIHEELSENRFLDIQNLYDVINNGCCAAYTPVDATAGFRFKPLPTLLFDVHAGYAIILDEHVLGFDGNKFRHFEQDQQIVKVGGSLHYHFQDIFTMEIGGDYFYCPSRELVTDAGSALELTQDSAFTASPYGKPKWRIHARFDGRIDKHWSLYSDNYLVGSRAVLMVSDQGTYVQKEADRTLKPYFDLNVGVEYAYNDRLAFFGQLNNFLAWTADFTPLILYGTPSQGVNCLFGVSWNF